ncbi:MAG TPA: hypothetical protein VK979_01840 [Guyparkeria sp.]|nr:hypothetical protein [Guyparkeria sp.]
MRRTLFLPFLFTAGMALIAGLAGCKAQVEAELDVIELRDRETRGLFATSQVMTGDCDRGTASSERENTLGWTSWVLSGVFPDTRFQGCQPDGEQAIATFRNMIVFDAEPGDTLNAQSHLNLKLHDEVLYIGLPSYVRGHIQRVRQQVGAASGPEISGHLVLLNSSRESFGYRLATFGEDDQVGWSEPRELAGAARVRLQLPPSLARQALATGKAPLFKIEANQP